MDHKSVAQQVLVHLGGIENIQAGAHCATRLRLVIKDQKAIDHAGLEAMEDLKGTFENAGQFQIIVGPGDVNQVYRHMAAAGMPEVSKDELKSIAAGKGNIVTRFLKLVSDIFVPLVPVLVGGGMLMALNNVLTAQNLFGPQSLIEMYPQWQGFSEIINLLAAAPFAFLPAIVGYSATKVYGGNPYLGLTMGLAMLSPSLANGYSVAALLQGPVVAEDGSVTTMAYWDLFGLQVAQSGYQGTVLPILVIAYILTLIEKSFHKVLRGVVDFIFTPTLTLLITGFLTFVLVGPALFTAGTWLGEGINWLYSTAGPLGGLIFGALYSAIVITGLHQSFPPIETMLWAQGGSFIFAIASMANVAQGAAALAVFLTTRDKKIKGVAGGSFPSAFLGITEPAIFGVNLRLRWPFYSAALSAAVGGLLIALFGVKASALGAAGLLGFLSIDNTVGAGWGGFWLALLAATVVSFVVAWIWGRKAAAAKAAEDEAAPEAALVGTDGYGLSAHLDGTVFELAEVSDQSFASGALGPGAAIDPSRGRLLAPAAGKITVAFPTGHAVGMKTDQGLELLMHIGFDTVELDGRHFICKVNQGQQVERGEVLVEFDMQKIAEAGYSLTTPLVITNAKKTVAKTGFAAGISAGQTINAGDDFLSVLAKEQQQTA